ncbi:MAG: DUF3182 family protein [Candidatus Levybacteria bacterium]|nr:DUF3182 family protein [Candidatus Levybacteria bacterium]
MPRHVEQRGHVVTYAGGNTESADLHEIKRITDLGQVIAEMTDREFGGAFNQDLRVPAMGELYFVPYKTLMNREKARRLGIETKDHLFGGVVDRPFKGTKAIAHGLVSEAAQRPDGWSEAFSDATKDVVLPGFTAFNHNEAVIAADKLFQAGYTVRGKRTLAAGGGDQHVLNSTTELTGVLTGITQDEMATFGYVLESNLQPEGLSIRSIGQVEIAGTMISYFGTQRETKGEDGETRYGGSDLYIARGNYAALLKHVDDDATKIAIKQARTFDNAAEKHLGVVASRRNYDIAQGQIDGQLVSGVLEQSWRIGGASGPEVLAIEAFRKDPALQVVTGSSFNQFKASGDFNVPGGARIHFEGNDPNYDEPMVTFTTLTIIK